MESAFKFKTFTVGAALLCAALGSAALTLGRVQGAAFVGKPLDVSVQVQFDGDEDAQATCLEAEVYYADTLLDPTRVSVSPAPAAGGAAAATTVRVQTTVAIDEPVVSFTLRAGCRQKLSKRYTLFADLPNNVVEPPVRAQLRQAPAAIDAPVRAAASQAARPPEASRPSAPQPQAEVAPRKARVAAAAPQPELQAVPAAPPRNAKSAKARDKARLKLAPLDLQMERDPVLRASTELLTPPQEDDPKRAEAAAWWRALNASPEQILREDARAQRLESDLKSLHAATAANQKGLVDLSARAQQAESERYANGLVYTLIGLCVASLAALVWVWQRLRAARAPNWRHGLGGAGDSLMTELARGTPGNAAEEAFAPAVVPAPVAASVVAATPTAAAAPVAVDIPVDLVDLDFDLDLMASAPHQPEKPAQLDATVSLPSALLRLDSEELEDVRHRGDFFMSLGQHEKAIDILSARIAQSGESSPLVCLDLLKIYHALGRAAEFESLRTQFNHWFAGQVPAFAAFSNEGRGLEDYPQVLERIVALWPNPAVLDYIESCAHHGARPEDPVFDLQAYRELLLLHGVAKRLIHQDSVSGFNHLSASFRLPARAPEALHRDARGQEATPVLPDPQADVETRGSPLS